MPRKQSGDSARTPAAVAEWPGGPAHLARAAADPKRSALLASPLFRAMRPAELDEIILFAAERRVPRGTAIFCKGDEGSSLLAVLRGRVRVSTVSPEGKEITLNLFGPGEVFGEIALLDGNRRSANAIAIEHTDLLVIQRRHFLPIMERNQELHEDLLALMCARLRQTSAALEGMALCDMPVRLARVLLKLAADYGQQAGAAMPIAVRMSQGDLANMVAASRESVNKQLRLWREDGVVKVEAGCLVLRRPQALRALVE